MKQAFLLAFAPFAFVYYILSSYTYMDHFLTPFSSLLKCHHMEGLLPDLIKIAAPYPDIQYPLHPHLLVELLLLTVWTVYDHYFLSVSLFS